jgi:hypothetical protein
MNADERTRAIVAGAFAHLAYDPDLKEGALERQELKHTNPKIRALVPAGISVLADVCHDGVEESGIAAAAEVLLHSTSGLRGLTLGMADGNRHLSFRGTHTPYGALTDGVLLACALQKDPKQALLNLSSTLAMDYAPEGTPEKMVRTGLSAALDHVGKAAAKSLADAGDESEAKKEEGAASDGGWFSGLVSVSTSFLGSNSDDSWLRILWDLGCEAVSTAAEIGHEALFDSLPEDIKLALTALNNGSAKDFQELMRTRLNTAVEQAEVMILEANKEGTLNGISGHSLGGIAAELAAVKLIDAGKLPADIEVTCFCSPGGRELFEFIGIAVPEGLNIMHVARAGDLVSRMGSVEATHKFVIDGLSTDQVTAAYAWLEEEPPIHALVAHGMNSTVWALKEGLAHRL